MIKVSLGADTKTLTVSQVRHRPVDLQRQQSRNSSAFVPHLSPSCKVVGASNHTHSLHQSSHHRSASWRRALTPRTRSSGSSRSAAPPPPRRTAPLRVGPLLHPHGCPKFPFENLQHDNFLPRSPLTTYLLSDFPSRVKGTPEWDSLVTDTNATVQLSTPVSWVKVNFGQAGFYRTCYSPKLLAALGPLVPTLPASDRAGLVGDSFALAAAGYQSTVTALSLLVHYKSERDYVVWANIAAGLGSLMSTWFAAPADVMDGMERFAVSLYGPLVAHLGWEPKAGESHLNSLLRTLANGRAAHLGDPGALKEARARFAKFCAGDERALSPDLRGGVFKAVLAHGGEAEFDKLVSIYEGAKAQELRIAVLAALGASKDPALIRRALEYNLSDKVRKQDLMYIVSSAAGNAKGRVLAWEFFQEKFETIQTMLDGSGFLLGRLLSMSTSALTSEEDARAVETFFTVRDVPALQRTVKQCVEKIRCNAGWLQRDGAAVAAWICELPK